MKDIMSSITIDAVFFAQTHVLRPEDPFFKLVGEKDTLIKVHVLSTSEEKAPLVKAELKLEGETHRLALKGPDHLPKEICIEPGKVVHQYEDSFTATVPARWIKRGLEVTIHAGDLSHEVRTIEIGPPLVLNNTMFDIHYFEYEDVDYPEGWEEEMAVRRPLTEFNVQRIRNVIFPELIIPPGTFPATRCTSTDDYAEQNGSPFNGKQAAALKWVEALHCAGGQTRLSAYFINIANVPAGGEAWALAGTGSLRRFPVLHHEYGHVLGLEDSPCEGTFPYIGDMHGHKKDGPGTFHGGPTWKFDPRVGFLSPLLSDNLERGNPGEYRKDPMGGGGITEERDEALAYFSDYSVRKQQEYLEKDLTIYSEEKQEYVCWHHYLGGFEYIQENDGYLFPIERDVEVYSILFAVSAVTERGNFIYELLGPYTSGLIDTFDPNVEEDRKRARGLNVTLWDTRRARRINAPHWDVCLRVEQGGVTKTFMMPVEWNPNDDPLRMESLQTRALNLPVRDGEIGKVEILLTPEASLNGIPDSPKVLYSRSFSDS
jgi:hypothetical protein